MKSPKVLLMKLEPRPVLLGDAVCCMFILYCAKQKWRSRFWQMLDERACRASLDGALFRILVRRAHNFCVKFLCPFPLVAFMCVCWRSCASVGDVPEVAFMWRSCVSVGDVLNCACGVLCYRRYMSTSTNHIVIFRLRSSSRLDIRFSTLYAMVVHLSKFVMVGLVVLCGHREWVAVIGLLVTNVALLLLTVLYPLIFGHNPANADTLSRFAICKYVGTSITGIACIIALQNDGGDDAGTNMLPLYIAAGGLATSLLAFLVITACKRGNSPEEEASSRERERERES